MGPIDHGLRIAGDVDVAALACSADGDVQLFAAGAGAGHWNEVGGPFKDGLNQTLKYVASSNPDTDLPWPNSRLLSGDVPAAVAALRERPGGNLVIMGSGQLVRSLLPRQLVDELFLMIHPIVLGSGQRLFDAADERVSLTLVDSAATTTGVIMATYQP